VRRREAGLATDQETGGRGAQAGEERRRGRERGRQVSAPSQRHHDMGARGRRSGAVGWIAGAPLLPSRAGIQRGRGCCGAAAAWTRRRGFLPRAKSQRGRKTACPARSATLGAWAQLLRTCISDGGPVVMRKRYNLSMVSTLFTFAR
jgi:hypothetical protein